eukprot:GHVR01061622.1.p2 GENE.GHVR01061622.1~~GHVR01061622.1.p2  ORF type:complete len:100 (-),score=15.15 GHVR01061622.1:630-929(-)
MEIDENIGFVRSFFGSQRQCRTPFWPPLSPSAAWLGVDVKRIQISVSCEASSNTGPVSESLPQPSAPIGGHRRPSAPCGWVLRYGTGSPLKLPPLSIRI